MLCRGLSRDIKKILITACNDISCAAIRTESMIFVTYTVKIGTANEKTKTLVPSATIAMSVATGQIYGTNYQDQDISLNKADIFKVRAIYMSADSSTGFIFLIRDFAPQSALCNGSG